MKLGLMTRKNSNRPVNPSLPYDAEASNPRQSMTYRLNQVEDAIGTLINNFAVMQTSMAKMQQTLEFLVKENDKANKAKNKILEEEKEDQDSQENKGNHQTESVYGGQTFVPPRTQDQPRFPLRFTNIRELGQRRPQPRPLQQPIQMPPHLLGYDSDSSEDETHIWEDIPIDRMYRQRYNSQNQEFQDYDQDFELEWLEYRRIQRRTPWRQDSDYKMKIGLPT
ncbi:unnamed protein product [Citrullus colocynthis]|uniref:Uncharacterized protein n=1 Tax=Citrullus colocynthis TaxID=252529 RepID=A0ABP0YFX2_9ROSI